MGDGAELIKTSDKGWMARLARAYKDRRSVRLVDDSEAGVDPRRDSLWDMGKKARLDGREMAAVCIALGVAAAGVGMIVLAFVDPEPTSKLGLLVGGGVACVLTGGLSAIHVLTKLKPPSVRVSPKGGFELSWD